MSAVRKPVDPYRRDLLAKTSIAAKELGLDKEALAAVVQEQTGKTSRTQISNSQLVDLLNHFKSRGWKAKRRAKEIDKAKPVAAHPMAKKARALWISGHHLGVIRDASEAALTAFAKRVTGGKDRGLAALQWIDGTEGNKLIEALKDLLAREAGIDWSRGSPRRCVLAAQMRLLNLSEPQAEAIGKTVTGEAGFAFYLDKDWDRLIAELGRQIRERNEHGVE